MTNLLGDFLRTTLRSGSRASIPLREEIALARTYLEVERARFGERLSVRIDVVPEAFNASVPPLILQPLVENAVRHGISHLLEGGDVREDDGSYVAEIELPFTPAEELRDAG